MSTTFDLTPDPRVLVALTHTPLHPLDALCELIDNAIDSFHIAKLEGIPVNNPLVIVDVPMQSELDQSSAMIRVRDNGPGMKQEVAENALKAGYSSQNPFDTLGLFGMGFNIATGKLGIQTRFLTTRREDSDVTEVMINLITMTEKRTYQVPIKKISKDEALQHGTVVEVSSWWPTGNPNADFVRKLVSLSKPRLREAIGRRYASIIRNQGARIIINGEECPAFEHCRWSPERTVERRGSGKIPAVIEVDKVVGVQRRCSNCFVGISPADYRCCYCGSTNIRTLEERVRGWVGIQRFDSADQYGIDLIRKGRAIRIAEKSALFEFVTELGDTIVDYPIDGPYGRIIGEIHLDHVPVDYTKQDFQRTSSEWQRAINFLRGETSLQPERVPKGQINESPIYRLFQGYRRVRTPGKIDMYMGYFDTDSGKPKRISREVERDYYTRFMTREPGYYDDNEWWKLVEQADQKPIDKLIECPECHTQNLPEKEVCDGCGHIFKGKECLNGDCAKKIQFSALSCPHCSASQEVLVKEPWSCLLCGTKNRPAATDCDKCGQARGTANPVSRDYLKANSNRHDDLCLTAITVQLADGSNTQPIQVDVYAAKGPITKYGSPEPIPLVPFKAEKFEIYIDLSHPAFKAFGIPPQQMVAAEVALYIYELYRRLLTDQNGAIHTLSWISWQIAQANWSAQLQDNTDRVRADVEDFFKSLAEQLALQAQEKPGDYFSELTDLEKQSVALNLIENGKDVTQIGDIAKSGEFFRFVDHGAIVGFFRRKPDMFFDGAVWKTHYMNIPQEYSTQLRKQVHETYLNCLEDLARFSRYREPDTTVTRRARLSLQNLQMELV